MSDWITPVMLWLLPSVSVLLAFLAAMMFSGNLPLFRRWRGGELSPSEETPFVSILIPARDEQAGIARCLRSVLANTGVVLEVIVLDDDSGDATGEIVQGFVSTDSRVRLIRGAPLPAGWNGKQHACYQLAAAANYDLFLFLDADVRLSTTALQQLTRRQAQYAATGSAKGQPIALLSAFPRQETGTFLEKSLIPMMHYILLCYLPFARMRRSTHPAYAAGCGQIFLTDRESYQRSGTHAAIRASRHDGLMLPRIYREQGMLSDCVDGTALATCRMYTNARSVVQGILKNANEGIANARLIVPFSILLGGANLLPVVTLCYALRRSNDTGGVNDPGGAWATEYAVGVSVVALALSNLPRWVAAWKFRQSLCGAVFHPLAVAIFLLLQWWAIVNSWCGKTVPWRGRPT